MKESVYQSSLIRTIKNLLPGCIILKNDPNYIQGIPDLIILYGITWAALEVKKSATASHRPNQEYYVKKMSTMSFAAFIYPEITQQVLGDMIGYLEWVNSKNLTLEDYHKITDDHLILQSLLSNQSYQEVLMN